MTATKCVACNETFERGIGQSHSKYCTRECRQRNREAKKSCAEQAKPTPYQKGDGNWYCTYQGRQHYLGNNLFKAQRKLEEILSGEIAPKLTTGPRVEALMEEYLATIEHVQSPDTIKTKKIFYKQFMEFLGENGTIASITAQKLEEYKQGLFKRGLMKMTVRNQLMLLSAFFDYAVRTKVLSSNPVSKIATIKQSPDPDPDHLTEEEGFNCAILARLQKPNIEVSPAGLGAKPHRVILIGPKSALLAGGDPQAERPLPRLTEAHAAPQLDHQEPHQRHYEGRLFKR